MTVREALLQGQQLLEDAGISVPRLTAEVLLLHAVSHDQAARGDAVPDRAWLYAHSSDELREVWWIHYGRYLHQRIGGQPTQYITGRQEFYGRDFRVTPDVLIPRPETEHLVEAALARITDGARVLDIGAGSGAIAVTLALESKAQVFSSDISIAALGVAQANARRLKSGVRFVACDLGSAFGSGTFDLVASNPPYVPERDRATTQREVRDFEPASALFAGDDGLDIYRRLVPEAARLLRPGGWLMMELGDTSSEPVREMLTGWHDVTIITDLAGIPRVVRAQAAE
ncbi:MAG: peptide chain release factor N(5)-glutamine methyltransferase [Bryobacteraceae bacterium]